MKYTNNVVLAAALVMLTASISLAQGVAVNESGATPDPSAMLDVSSTSKGILIPRLTTAQRNLISQPQTGLMIFQIDGDAGFYYNAGTPASPLWQHIGESGNEGGQWSVNGNHIYYNDGNVGVGTANPQLSLHLNSNSVSTGLQLTTTNTGTTTNDGFILGIRYLQDELPATSYNFLWGNENIPTYFYTHSQLRMQISAAGNVGIGGFFEPSALLHTRGIGIGEGNVVFVGSYKSSNPGNPPVSGAGTRMMWYPDKAAFRAGETFDAEWNIDQVGAHSTAMGYNVIASGPTSFSVGRSSIAEGETSIAIGFYASATGVFAKSIGNLTSATGNISTAMGTGTIAPSFAEFVVGRLNTEYTPLNTTNWNNADRLFVIGNGADNANRSDAMVVMKHGGIAMGLSQPAAFSNLHLHDKNANLVFLRLTNTETGTSSTDGLRIGIRDSDHQAQLLNFENGPITLGTNGTERVRITADGNVGIGTNTPNALLHTNGTGAGEGNVVFVGSFKGEDAGTPLVSGAGTRMMWYPDRAAFRVGLVTDSQWNVGNMGNNSTAWGYNTTASGQSATAWGSSTTASGQSTTVWGVATTAPSYLETVFGSYNTLYSPVSTNSWVENDRLFVIGNGISTSTRSDALTVMKNGNIGIRTSNPNARLQVNAPSGEDALRIQVNNDTKLFIPSNGNVGIGSFNTPDAALHVRHGNIANHGIRIQNLGANNRHWTIHTNNGAGTLILYSSIGGSSPVGNFNGTTGAYSATSNRHLKTEVTSLGQDIIEKLMQLEPLRYRYLRGSDKQFTFGFMAEDILPLFPELVEIIGEVGENLALNYAGFSVVAIQAIQLQQKEIDELKIEIKKLSRLVQEINSLKAALEPID
jgi:hypothetical protein